MDNINAGRDFRAGWWLILAAMLCVLVSSLFLGNTQMDYYIKTLLGELSIIIPVLVGLFMMVKRGEKESLGFQGFPIYLLPLVIILPIVSQPFVNVVTLPISFILNIFFDLGDTAIPAPNGPGSVAAAIFTFCILAPVIEEVLCRGVFISLLKGHGAVVSIGASALAFTLLHFSPTEFIVVFFLGVILGAIRYLTNSLWCSIIAHSANNLFAFIVQLLPQTAIGFVFSLISIVLFPLLAYLFIRFAPRVNIAGMFREKGAKMCVSVGAILCFLTYVLYALLILVIKLSGIITGGIYYAF